MVLRRTRHGCGVGVHAADDRVLGRDTAGGHRGLRAGAARAAFAVVHAWAILSAARKRSPPLPIARHRVSRTTLAFGPPFLSLDVQLPCAQQVADAEDDLLAVEGLEQEVIGAKDQRTVT